MKNIFLNLTGFGNLSGLFITILFSSISFAQTPEKEEKPKPESKIEAGFEGILGLSFGDRIQALHVGGPSFKYKLGNNFKIGIGALPSLIMLNDKIMPRLGFSPILEYKKWNFIAPYYGFDSSNRELWSFGLGYRFR